MPYIYHMGDHKRLRKLHTFSLLPETKDGFYEACKKNGKSMSSVLERLMKFYVNAQDDERISTWGYEKSPNGEKKNG